MDQQVRSSEIRSDRPASTAHGAQALLDLGRGDLDSAAEHLEVVLLMCRDFAPTAYGWTAALEYGAPLDRRRQPAEAIESVRESLARSADPERDVHMRVCHRLAIRGAADIAEVARPLGDKATLISAGHRPEFDAVLDRHAQFVRASPGGGDSHLELDVALAKAELSRLMGRSSAAGWAGAAAAAVELQHAHEAAYSRFRQAEALLLSRGSRAAAQTAVAEAHRIASELGAAPLQKEIEQLAVRSRLDVSSRPLTGRRRRCASRPTEHVRADAARAGRPGASHHQAHKIGRSPSTCSSARRRPACTFPTSSRSWPPMAARRLRRSQFVSGSSRSPETRTNAPCPILDRHPRQRTPISTDPGSGQEATRSEKDRAGERVWYRIPHSNR